MLSDLDFTIEIRLRSLRIPYIYQFFVSLFKSLGANDARRGRDGALADGEIMRDGFIK
jgi:hypothetical protein